ncbi:lysylphosphatidylglycerol synthase transmembrane domain-containing protein [Negadavirga shengliensis]|uniref:Lysylphosphatidylglycerol synthase transmembrane domain-containing protein n=1 Tax=Negadavirga shengliensis TaxID=1389218 RepID=A0ABV9T0R4_9BACT
MRNRAKKTLQVALSLAIALTIFYYLYKDIHFEQVNTVLKETVFLWIIVSVLISIAGYFLRAWRWKLLIEASETKTISTLKAFWALMFGYLVNLLVPRAGELARCAALKKTDRMDMGRLLGTVILERSVDLIFMMVVVLLAFMLESEHFIKLFAELVSSETLLRFTQDYGLFLVISVLLVAACLFVLVRIFHQSRWIRKIRQFIRQFVSGLTAIAKVKTQGGFWLSSGIIWVIYYLMMYFLAQAMPSTASLEASSVLMVMVMGSIGMIAPVQGGIGTFHALVAFILLFYGIAEEQGKIFAMVVHASQMLTILLLGAAAMGVLLKYQTKVTL